MTAQAKYITSIIETFSTYLESLSVSTKLSEETTVSFVKFLQQKKDYNTWTMSELEKFIETEKLGANTAILIRRYIENFTPYQTDIFLHQFLGSLKAENKSISTIKNYRSDISQLISLIDENKISALFTQENIKKFVKDQFSKNLKASSVKRKLVSIAQFSAWAEKEKLIENVSFWISDVESLFGKKNRDKKSSSEGNKKVGATIEGKTTSSQLDDFLVSLEVDESSKSTIKNYKSDISQLISFAGDLSLVSVFTEENLKKFVDYQRSKGLKLNSIKRKIVSISQFAVWAEKRNDLKNVSLWLNNLSTGTDVGRPVNKVPIAEPVRIINANHDVILKIKDHDIPQVIKHKNWSLPIPKFIKDSSVKTNSKDKESARGYKSRLNDSLKEFSNSINFRKNKTFLPYFNLFMIILFFLGLGYFGYSQFIRQTPDLLAYPTSPVRPNRSLSFQGRLTDTAQNPVTSATNMAFRLYDTGPSTGGTLLWDSSTCSVTPDQDGIFNVGLGDDCGAEITENVFTENSNVWLEVDVAAETLTPRQGIKTVAYALNSETVQGYPVSATGAATTNTILVMDAAGQVLLGEVSPTLKATTGTFSIEAQALTLQTSSGSNGDIIFDPDGLGEVLSTGYFSAPSATFAATYAGGTSLVLKGGPSGTGNIQEWQDSSGTVLSVVDEAGNVGINTANPLFLLDVAGTASVNSLNINDAYTFPTADGTNGYVLQTNGSGTLSWASVLTDSPSVGAWSHADHYLYPDDYWADDLIIGGNSTASAKFQVFGTTGSITSQGNLVMVGTSDLQGSVANSTGNVVIADVVDLGSATTGVNITAAGAISDIDGDIALNDSVGITGSLTTTVDADFAGTLTSGTANAFSVDATGNVTAGTWTATAVAANYGGTGQTVYAVGDLLYASGTTTLSKLADVATGNVLLSGGVDTAPSWGKVTLGTHTTGNYVATLTGTANQITASASTGDVTLSIPSDFRAPGTVNAVTGLYTGATAGTERITSAGNLTNIGTTQLNGVTYTWPGSDGSSGYVLQTNGSGTVTWTDPASAVSSSIPWIEGAGILYPKNSTVDLLIGGQASSSAKFAVLNMNSGTPTASISGTTANVATYLTGEGNLATTNMASLVLGSATTGSIALNPKSTTGLFVSGAGYVGIGTTTPGTTLDILGTTDLAALKITNTSVVSNPLFQLYGPVSTNVSTGKAFAIFVNGESYARSQFYTDGKFGIGPGSSTRDIFLSRSAANTFSISSDSGSGIGNLNITGSVGIGTTAPTSKLHVSGATTGKALSIFDELGDQDIISASVSGVTKFRVANDGYVYGERFVDNTNSNYYIDPAAGGYSAIMAGNVGIGITTPLAKLSVNGDLSVNTATISATYAGGKGLVVKGGPSGTANIQEWQNSSDTPLAYIDASGNYSGVAGTLSSTLTLPNSNTLTGVANYLRLSQGLSVGGADTYYFNSSGNINANAGTLSSTLTLPNSNTLTGVANYLRLSQGLSVGGADTYYFNSAGSINANVGTFAGTLTANGTLDANGLITLGDGGETIALTSSDWTIGTTGNVAGIGSFVSDGATTLGDGGATNDSLTINTGTGDVSIVAADTAGSTINLSWSTGTTQASVLYGLDINMTNLTPNGTNGVQGIIIRDPAVNNGSVAYALNVNGTNWDYDISLQYGETISNSTDGTIAMTGNLNVSGTTGLTLSGTGGEIVFANAETIDNDTNGTILITAAITQTSAKLAVNGAPIGSYTATIRGPTCIDTNNDGTCEAAWSDIRLKKDISEYSGGLDIINQLSPVNYTFRYDEFDMGLPHEAQVGLIAQELQTIFPQAVRDTDMGYYQINYEKLVPITISAIQEQQTQIKKLNKDLNLLNNIDAQISKDSETSQYIVTNTLTNSPISRISAFAKAVVGQIRAGLVQTKELQTELISPIADSDLIIDLQLDNTKPSSKLSVKGNDDKTVAEISGNGNLSLLGSLIIGNDASISGKLTTDSIKTNSITTKTLLSNELTTTTAHLVDATVSGTLYANNIKANNIEAASARIAALEVGMAQLENIKATTAEIVNATVSGTLYADNIYNFEQTIATSLQTPGLLDLLTGQNSSTASSTYLSELYETVNSTQFEVIAMADLDLTLSELNLTQDDVVLTGTALYVEKYFKVNGAGYISDSLAVGNSIFVGNGVVIGSGDSTTQITNGIIAYITPNPDDQILKIQPTGQGSIDLLAGLVIIDDSGLVKVNGNFEATGDVKVGGTLLANLIKPTDFGNPLQVQVAGIDTQTGEVKKSRFEIINEVGAPVATFSAQGRAEFAGGVGIGSEDLGSSLINELSAEKTSGKATIKLGASAVKIKSALITENTMIYVTAVGSTNNQVLYVKSQLPQTVDQEGEFIVGFDLPTNTDVSFNWWIVN